MSASFFLKCVIGDMVMSKENELLLTRNPAKMKNLSVGCSEKDILIAFNLNENQEPEYSCVFPAEHLKNIISILLDCGITFQEEYGKDIGFPKKKEKEE